MPRKILTIFIYTLCWLSYYQIIEIMTNPSNANLLKLAWSIFAGALFAYVMGFDFKLKWPKKESSNIEI